MAEKARLANENSIYTRENRFLREIVEYHQLTMQDVVYLDEGTEEVTEVYPLTSPGMSRMLSVSPRSSTSLRLPSEEPPSEAPPEAKEIFPVHIEPQESEDLSGDVQPTAHQFEEDTKRPS